MTTPEPNAASIPGRRFQFTLRGLLWFTTVVAVLCASVASARRLWGDLGSTILLTIAIVFWPTIAALVLRTCPDNYFPGRLRVYVTIGVAVVVMFWVGMLSSDGYNLVNLFALACASIASLIFWAPQSLAIRAVMTDARERSRRMQSQGDPANPPQGELPSSGADDGTMVN